MSNILISKLREYIGTVHIDQCHTVMKEAAEYLEIQACEIKWLEYKLTGYKDWKSAAIWQSDEKAKEIERLKCQIELTGRTVAYAEFTESGNIRMWVKPESATPEQRRSMVPLCISPQIHYSDCAVYNEPAYPNGPCDCGHSYPNPIAAIASQKATP